MMRAALSAASRIPRAASLLKRAVAFALASALAACVASARGGQTDARGEFKVATGTPAGAPAAFEFESGGFSYHVAANGNGRRVKGDRTRLYNLHLNSGESIRRLYFAEYGDDLLLLCDVDGGEAGPSVLITRLEQPSMRALWRQSAPTDGVEALRQGGALYLGGAGFVARLELNSGAYAWQHRDRREAEEGRDRDSPDREGDERDGARVGDDRESVQRREAEALIPPGRYVPLEVTGDTVVFGPARGSAEQEAKTVRVNRKTGKIVSVE
jgi:hypothetical protein